MRIVPKIINVIVKKEHVNHPNVHVTKLEVYVPVNVNVKIAPNIAPTRVFFSGNSTKAEIYL